MNDYQYLQQAARLYPTIYQLIKNPRSHLDQANKINKQGWSVLIELINKNKLVPFAYHLINCQECQEKLPKKAWQEFKRLFFLYSFSKQFYQQEKEAIHQQCKKKAIPLILLKDLSRFNLAYPKNVFPSQSDWDILAKAEDFEELDSVLKKLGYQLRNQPQPHKTQSFIVPEAQYLKTKPLPLGLEIKFKLLAPDSQATSCLTPEKINQLTNHCWQSAKKNGLNYPSLEQELLFLTLHLFFKDSMQGLRNLYDIHQLITVKQSDINWSKILKVTKDLKLTNHFIFVLLICQKTFQTKLAKVIKQHLSLKLKLVSFLWPVFLTSAVLSPTERKNQTQCLKIKEFYYFVKFLLKPSKFCQKWDFSKAVWTTKTIVPFVFRLLLFKFPPAEYSSE